MKQKQFVKPSIKGAIMVIIGVWNTHLGISIALVIPNLIFGFCAFLFLAMGGIFLSNLVIYLEESSQNNPQNFKNSRILRGIVLFGVMYIIGSTITVYNVVHYDQEIWVMYFVAFLGILWLVLGFSAVQWKKSSIIAHITVSLAFAIGIFYGAISNFLIFPIYIYFFFLAAFFVQLSREFIKDLPDIKENNDESEISGTIKLENSDLETLKKALIFQILAITFAILLPFMGIYNPILILWVLIPGLVLIGLATYLTWKSIRNQEKMSHIGLLLKIGILLVIIAFFLAGE